MSSSLTLAFFESEFAGQPGSIEEIIESAQSSSIEISNIQVGSYASELHASWQTYEQLTPEGWQIAYNHQQIGFHFLERRPGLERVGIVGHVEIQWTENAASQSNMPVRFLKLFTDSTAMFTQVQYDSKQNCDRLLTLARRLYTIYRPQFGWIERDLLSGYTTQADIVAQTIPHIYWANFFGPQYVEKYGLAFFEQAPGWLCEVLGDGGCLYVLSPDTNRKKGAAQLETAVKDYFSVESVRKKHKKRRNVRGRHPSQPEPLDLPELEAFRRRQEAGELAEEDVVDFIVQVITRAQEE